MREIACIISFRPMSASLGLARSIDQPESMTIRMVMKLDWREDVHKQDKASLKDVEWVLRLKVPSGENAKNKAIGYLCHIPETDYDGPHYEESCEVEIHCDQATFNSLLASLQAGRIPNLVNLKVAQLDYGNYDGTLKIWDTEKNKIVLVTEMNIHIPLVLAPAVPLRERSDDSSVLSAAPSEMAKNIEKTSLQAIGEHARVLRRSISFLSFLILVLMAIVFMR